MKKKTSSLGRIFGEVSFNILLLLAIFWSSSIFINLLMPFEFLIILSIIIALSFVFIVRSVFVGYLIENYLKHYGLLKEKDDKTI